MSRNRMIYQSESLFVGNAVDATGINDNKELIRVQGANYGFNINRTDVNQYGSQLRIDTIQLESPTVTFDFSYYLGDGSNEKNIGFDTSANYQFAGAFMDSFSGNNFYILTSDEGQDSVDFKSGDYYNMIGIGNAFLTNYNVNLSVGSVPIAELSYEAANISSQNGLVSGNLITGDLPSIEPELGNTMEGLARMKSPIDRGFSGPSVIKPGDVVLDFPGFGNEGDGIMSKIKGNGGFHMQNATISLPMERTSMARVGAKYPYARVLNYPINATLNVSSVLSDVDAENLIEIISVCRGQLNKDISITLNRCVPSPFEDIPDSMEPSIKWTLKGVDLISEVFTSQIGSNKAVDMAFRVQIGSADDITKGIICEIFKNCSIIGDQEQTIVYNIGGAEIKSVYDDIPDYWVKNSGEVAEYSIGSEVRNIGLQSFFNTSGTSLQIPDGVRNIGQRAFEECSSLESVEVGFYLTDIEDRAFFNCTSLESINFCNSSLLKAVGVDAFRNTKLINLTLPSSVETIGQSAFMGATELQYASVGDSLVNIETSTFEGSSSLKTFELSDSVEKIGDQAFKSCTSLSSFYCGESLTNIEANAFYNCTSLASVNFNEGLESIGDWAFYNTSQAQVNIPGSVSLFGEYAFFSAGIQNLIVNSGVSGFSLGCFYNNRSLSNIELPDTLEVINNNCFQNCTSLNTVNIPDSVHTIGTSAFQGIYNVTDSVEIVNFGSGLKIIGDSAFKYTRSLDSAVLPEGLEQIGDSAFQNCFVLSGTIDIPDSVISIGTSAYENCYKISVVSIGAGISNVSDSCFQNCTSLTGVDIPNTVLTMEQEAFMGCTNLSGININTTLSDIPTRCFQSCRSLTGVDIPSNIISIGTSSFASCSELTGINFAEGIEAIGNSAFQSCIDLTGISFPNSLISIGVSSFNGCTSLSGELTYNQNLESVDNSAFANTDIVKINFNTNPDFTIIEDNCFQSCRELTGIDLTANITNINSSAFLNCYKLSGINFNETITDISNSAFQNCTSLTEITYPESLINVGTSAFKGCSNIETINFNTNAAFTNITANCFQNNTSLITLTIPDNIVNIDGSSFQGCNQITNVDFGDFTKYIGISAFASCFDFNNLIIPDTVTGIDDSAFSLCSSLDTMNVFPEGLIDIGDSAFYNCPLTGINDVITIPDSVTDIGDSAFYNNKFSGFYLGANIDYLSPRTFESCVNLSGIDLSLIDNIGNYCFKDCTNFSEYLIPDGITYIGRDAFNNTKVPDCTIPNSLTKINSYTFSNCSELTGIINGQNLTWIDTYAFNNCTSLKEYYAPASLNRIGTYAFNGCTSLSGLDLNQVDTIDARAFRGVSIDYVDVPDTVTSLSTFVFQNCPLLSGFSIGLGIDYIPNGAFKNCTSISGLLNIQSHIKTIGGEAFRGLNKLTGVSFPEGMEFIGGGFTNYYQPNGNGSFSQCSNISGDIVLPSTLTGLGRFAFYQCDLVDTFRFNSPSAPKTRSDALPGKFINDPFNNPIHAPIGAEASYSGLSYIQSSTQGGNKNPINWSNLNILFDL